MAFLGFALSLLGSCSCGLVGIQVDSPDGPASARSSSDRLYCCGLRFLAAVFGNGTSSSSDAFEDAEEIDGSLTTRCLPLPFPFFFLLPESSSVSVSLPNSANKFSLYVCEIVVGFVTCVTDLALHHVFNDFKLGFNLKSCFAGRF